MASRVPFAAMNLVHNIDLMTPGNMADLVLLDNQLRVTSVWVHGDRLEAPAVG